MADLTHKDVTAMLEDRRTIFGPLHAEWETDEQFLLAAASNIGPNQENPIMGYLANFPKGFPLRVPPLITDAVREHVNLLLPGETPLPKVLQETYDEDNDSEAQRQRRQRAMRQRDDLERKLRALLAYVESYSAESPLHPWAQHTVALGAGVLAHPISRDRWLEHPLKVRGEGDPKSGLPYRTREPRTPREQQAVARWKRSRLGAMPFDVRAVHPATAFWDPYHTVIEDMIEEQQVDAAQFALKYPHLELSPRGDGNKSSKLVIYCSPDWWGMWLDKRPLLKGKNVNEDGVAENTTGVLWYKLAYYGEGYLNRPADWSFRVQGLIRAIRGTALSLISDHNVMEHAKLNYVFGPEEFLVKGPTGEAEAQQYHTGPASVWIHGEDVERVRSDIRQMPNWLFNSESLVRGSYEGHTGKNVLGGNWEGPETARGITSRQGLAKGPIKTAKQSMEQALQGMVTDMLWMAAHELGEKLTIPTVRGYETLDPKDIPEASRIVIELSPPTADERLQQLSENIERMKAGALSQRSVIRSNPDIEDVDDELAEVDADKIMTQGDTLNVVKEAATKRFQAWLQTQPGQQSQPAGGEEVPIPALIGPETVMPQNNGFAGVPPPPVR